MLREAIKKFNGQFRARCRCRASNTILEKFWHIREDLRRVIVDMTKRLCQDKTAKHFDTFLACRLIPLEKQLGVRPEGIR